MTQPAHAESVPPRSSAVRLGTEFRRRILPNWGLYLIVGLVHGHVVKDDNVRHWH